MEEGVVEMKGFFSGIRKDKLLFILIFAILLLGVYVRFSHYNEEGLWSDDSAFVPGGLMFFYDSPYYPGLSVGNFPLGYYFIGAGCMLSGEDFSQVVDTKPMYYPDRPLLIGEPLTKGERYCHMPMYFFGIIFFFLIVLLAFLMLDKYSATFVTAFFAFYPPVLLYSRWIRTDIVFWVFLVLSLIFIWKGYTSEKASKKEFWYFVLGFCSLGLAQAAKETAAVFVFFAVGIFLSKYFVEVMHYMKSFFKSLELKFLDKFSGVEPKLMRFKRIIIYSFVGFVFFFLLPFRLNPKNVYDTYMMYQQFNSEMSTISFSLKGIYTYFYNFFLTINIMDTILFIFAFVLLVALIFKKNKGKLDNFLLYFTLIGMVVSIFLRILEINRLAIPFLLFFIFLMGLSFSDSWMSIPKLVKIKPRTFFFVFMIVYVVVSFTIALSTSPYFISVNRAHCLFDKSKCVSMESAEMSGFSSNVLYNYLKDKLGPGETFYGSGDTIHFYIKRSQHLTNYQFDTQFKQQTGHDPTLSERIQYYRPNNETIRYLFISPYQNLFGADGESLMRKYEPNDIIRIQDMDIFYVYDLKSLKEKK